MNVERLDHLVLTVTNIETTCDFYEQVLGTQRIAFAPGRTALAFGAQKINLHETGRGFQPAASKPTPGSADLCFITSGPLAEAVRHVKAHGIEILVGPTARVGALGPMQSFYFRDPDGNLIEVASYE